MGGYGRGEDAAKSNRRRRGSAGGAEDVASLARQNDASMGRRGSPLSGRQDAAPDSGSGGMGRGAPVSRRDQGDTTQSLMQATTQGRRGTRRGSV